VVLGTTRVGKTRLCEVLVAQDIRRGDTTIVFDPKGDVKLLQRMYAEAKRAGREKDMWVFHLGYPQISDRYSPIADYSKITEVASRIANALPSEGQSAAFKDFVWRFVNMIAKTGAALGDSPSYKWLYAQATNIDSLAERYFKQYLQMRDANWRDDYDRMASILATTATANNKKTGRSLEAATLALYIQAKSFNDETATAIISVLASEKSYFEKLVSSLYPLLEKLTTGEAGKLLSPDASDLSDKRRIFSWENILKTKGIVYIGLDALSDYEVAGCVGNAMFADLTSLAGRIYKENKPGTPDRVRIHADEFNELVDDEFVPMLNKAGGAGYQVTVYTQTWDDVEARVGNRAKAAQMAGNLNSMIMLRVKNITTAEMLTNQLPLVALNMRTTVSGSSDGGQEGTHFGAKTEDRFTTREVPTLQPADLVKLPKGQAFALLDGGQLFKIRLPLPDETDDPCWPSDLNAVFDDMQRKYNDQGDDTYFGPSRTLASAVGFAANGRAISSDDMITMGGTAHELDAGVFGHTQVDTTLFAQLVGKGVAVEGKHLGW
jgi:conjugative coupling factor TraD (TOL family)